MPEERSPDGRPRGYVPWWVSAILCAATFLLGASTSTTLPGAGDGACTSSLKPSEICPQAFQELQSEINGLREHIATREASNGSGTSVNCPEQPRCNVTSVNGWEPAPKEADEAVDGVIFDETWVSDPNSVMKTIKLCARAYDYSWESLNTTNPSRGYYTGVEIPPYQMDFLQYISILITIAAIPSKPMLAEMESKGENFTDSANGAYYKVGRGNIGPRVLFWGCGADTPMHAHVMEYLGGEIAFIDNSEQFRKQCLKHHPNIRLVQPTGDPNNMTQLVGRLVANDGSGMETDDVEDPLMASQWMPDLDGIETEAPWDVIVVDGPGMDLGRSQPLYMAKRLAQSYGPNHYTHIFLHDASRSTNCIIANGIMGHDPKHFIGNVLPRKGLKHWRIPGRNRPLPPTKSKE